MQQKVPEFGERSAQQQNSRFYLELNNFFLAFLGARIQIEGSPSRYCLDSHQNEDKNESVVEPGCVDDLNEAELQLLHNEGMSDVTLSPTHRICYCDTDLCNDGNLLPTNGVVPHYIWGGSFIIILISLLI